MGIRNCKDIGENLQKIVSRLMTNDILVKLLYYTEKDPYSKEPLTMEQKKAEVYEKLIKIVPRVGPKDTAKSLVVVQVTKGITNEGNDEFKDLALQVEVFVPLTQWIIKDSNLRPFAILGEVQNSLNGKTINGLGKMVGGDFELSFISEEIACYIQQYRITSYE